MPAAQEGSAYRPLQEGLKPEEVFCFKYLRAVGLDNVVTFARQRLQVEPDQQRRSYARAQVEVHERLDGSLALYYGQRCLTTTPARHPWLPTCGRVRGRRAGHSAWIAPRPQTQPWCSLIKLPRLRLGSRLLIQGTSPL